jgi:hypothetical protein
MPDRDINYAGLMAGVDARAIELYSVAAEVEKKLGSGK